MPGMTRVIARLPPVISTGAKRSGEIRLYWGVSTNYPQHDHERKVCEKLVPTPLDAHISRLRSK
jgi:hypothetical protein